MFQPALWGELSPPLTPLCFPQCAGEENCVDSRTIYVGHREPPPGAEAYILQRHPDNRIVSSKVSFSLGPCFPWALWGWRLPALLLGPSLWRLPTPPSVAVDFCVGLAPHPTACPTAGGTCVLCVRPPVLHVSLIMPCTQKARFCRGHICHLTTCPSQGTPHPGPPICKVATTVNVPCAGHACSPL